MRQKFLLCIENEGYEASLEIPKLYETIPDKEAERHNQASLARIIFTLQVFCPRQTFNARKDRILEKVA